ncbi:hypothetical protein M426DRAFT_61910, partial [Hypoxylon sp. CI-4A]
KPALIIVQGSWQNANAFDVLLEKLHTKGYPAEHVKLPSIGSSQTPLPGFSDDIATIQSVISRYKDKGQRVIVICHSSGGASDSNAVAGFDNISGVIYLSAFVIPKGKSIAQLGGDSQPWMDGTRVFLRQETLADSIFNDLHSDTQSKWVQEVSHTSASLFEEISKFEPWSEGVPCGYIFCSKNNALPLDSQKDMAARLGPDIVAASVEAGHCPYLSVPDELVDAIVEVEGKLTWKSLLQSLEHPQGRS